MKLPEEFWEQLPLKTDVELYDMLAHPEDYLPEALAAAKDELSKRDLGPEKVTEIEAGVRSRTEAAEAKSQERLSWPIRICIFIFCAGLAGLVLGVYYEGKGYKGKASDCWTTLAASFFLHGAVAFFSQAFR